MHFIKYCIKFSSTLSFVVAGKKLNLVKKHSWNQTTCFVILFLTLPAIYQAYVKKVVFFKNPYIHLTFDEHISFFFQN